MPTWFGNIGQHAHAPITSKKVSCSNREIAMGLCSEVDVGPPLFILLQSEMLTDGARSGWCEQPLTKARARYTWNSLQL
jgi:hypothetical protein